jgi:hypothetical protein
VIVWVVETGMPNAVTRNRYCYLGDAVASKRVAAS